METLGTIGSALGLGWLAGIRLYLTVLAAGLAIRYQWIDLPASLSSLDVLADGRVLAVAGIGVVAEFFADKIPWVDSAWDSLHTFIRPIGAGLLGLTAMRDASPSTQLLLALAMGGVAFTGHTSKAATRLAANHSPEPFSNMALSLAGDLAVPAGVWAAFEYPEVTLAVIAVFTGVFAFLAPRVFRAAKLEWLAFRSLFTRWYRGQPAAADTGVDRLPTDNLRRVFAHLTGHMVPVPAVYASMIEKKLAWRPRFGVRAAAADGVSGLRRSTGYLVVSDTHAAFAARRWFRHRVRTWELANLGEASLHRRILLDELRFDTPGGALAFDIFKGGGRYTTAEQTGAVLRTSD